MQLNILINKNIKNNYKISIKFSNINLLYAIWINKINYVKMVK